MAPRRETRREAEAFRAHLEERSTADRHRLLAEHHAFLSGERQNDAAFGDGTRNTSAERPERVPASGIHLPPTGKTVAYIEAAKQRMADRQAEKAAAKKNTAAKNKGGRSSKTKTSTPKSPGKKKISKRQQSALTRKKAKERERAALKERRGADSRKRALADLKRKRSAEPAGLSETMTVAGSRLSAG
ncbi:hypothetical protein GN958_ATG02370 [Phytophthora infestans]|uniref:Uncharacterized protein n=1 Tax=Phytophthora infestans TaxID=4787 RepID=A0A8S9VB49_PHYIN|nr:hypothetical protein GN958_ATG02370 [Phytophthora infestans]